MGVVFILLAWTGPQWGTTKRTITPKGIDLLVAVDLSKSMLARDVHPNRLERVKLTLTNLLPKVRGDRLGLIAFSGSSFLQCPLTLDHQAFAKSLEDLKVGSIPRMGTNLALPIQEAARSFSQDDTDKFLVLISDGEDLEGQGLQEAKKAAKEGIRIYTIGIGSEQGAFIPTDPVDQEAKNFLTDRQGKKVVTKLDEVALRDIAVLTGGQYLPIGPTGEGISYVFSELQAHGQKKLREHLSTELPINRYQVFILIGLAFLLSESLTSASKKKLGSMKIQCLLVFFLFMAGCWKPENIRLAENAMEQGDPITAADLYTKQMSELNEKEDEKGLLSLNTGLAYLEAGKMDMAEKYLRLSLNQATNLPDVQSKALNGLGNIYYSKSNAFLDQQNVNHARKAWEKAREFYSSAFSINGHSLAEENLASLNKQIQERIESVVCKIEGIVWRDINGNGKAETNEPRLQALVYWDRNQNGEHNQTDEPSVRTDAAGRFAFEWISATFPASLPIASVLSDQNQSTEDLLVPLFPAPPPPMEAKFVKNHLITLPQPGLHKMMIPWRGAPVLKGSVWNDINGNAEKDRNESGSAAATIFLDSNGNFRIDENETSFKPSEDGSFAEVVQPGQFSVCIMPEQQEANITRPIEEHKAYLTWVDFEQHSQPLLFGIQEDGNSSDSTTSQDHQTKPSSQPEQSNQEDQANELEKQSSEEINALYERLLQESESKSEPLPPVPDFYAPTQTGRDY
ncbi:MAG: VWA domain-containing protein [Opitutae bacterium]